jgi:RNA polymerase sigma factor (sigma-70 family)
MVTKQTARARGNTAEETALLSALLGGAQGSARDRLWRQFVDSYERLIVSCVLKVLRRYGAAFSREDLDDLVGDVWLSLLRDDLRKLRQYDAARGFRLASFLGLVATNLTIDHLRGRVGDTTPLDEVPGEGALVGHEPARDPIEERQRAHMARLALSRLSEEERTFVVECFHEEASPEALAKRLGLSANTVYSRKFKVRAKMARIVAGLDLTPAA